MDSDIKKLADKLQIDEKTSFKMLSDYYHMTAQSLIGSKIEDKE